jgi:3'-phosphoadenosine 5'-phosphosulfate sulfotransferase (PAPS reductase)/FAD synthetase
MKPYFIDEPAVISLSGGRTSGYMLYKILEAHGGLPDHIKVVFANTGKEMDETLDFVRDIGKIWGVDIIWVELASLKVEHQEPRNKIIKTYKLVDYATASRNGEPFDVLLDGLPAIPNVVARTCTAYMKMRAIQWYADGVFGHGNYIKAIGIRKDERRRAVKLHNQVKEGALCILPMYDAGDTVADVFDFWSKNNFDLRLQNNGGVTDWGNCDLCHLKGTGKRISIIAARPDLADWWIDAEEKKQQYFRRDMPSYKELKIIATEQTDMFGFDDETIPCFCGD